METAKSGKKTKKNPAHGKDVRAGLKATTAGLKHHGGRHGGLGRGLDALFSRETTKMVSDAAVGVNPDDSGHVSKTVLDVPVERIVAGKWQPRTDFDENSLNELADSVKTHGIIQPLLCRPASGGNYELIGGERRLRAAIRAGLSSVPVILMESEDKMAAELALVENLQREDLNVIDEAEGYKTLADTFGMSQADIAERVGKARATVTNVMRMLSLPDEVKQLLRTSGTQGAEDRPKNDFSPGHAKVLLGLADESEMIRLASECVRRGWSVRMLEDHVKRVIKPKSERTYSADIPEWYLNDICDRLRRYFKTEVTVVSSLRNKNGRTITNGRVEIEFRDNDDLGRLLEMFGIEVND